MKEFAALGFGEVMMRLSPPGEERIARGDQFSKCAGGAELNVISGIARLGLRSGLISKLPDSVVGTYIRNQIRSYGVSDDYVVDDARKAARLGVYYYEGGAYPRKPQVTYDRDNSSFTTFSPGEIPADVYEKARLFHTSGISLALGGSCRRAALDLLRSFRAAGALISFDVNYRAALWTEQQAREAIEDILPCVDILFASEETFRRMFGRSGPLEDIQRQFCETFGVSTIASTMRTVNSPRSHNFTSLLYDAKTGQHFTEKPYVNIDVVDRLGSGDAFVAGALYALLSGRGHADAVSFGNAMSGVKSTVPGDLITTDLREIESVIADHRATGPVSEMKR